MLHQTPTSVRSLDRSNISYPTPSNWQDFERLCEDLWKEELGPETQGNGRQGQEQNGVDVYGQDGVIWVGIQCKGKTDWPGKPVTRTELREEVRKAKNFDPKLTRFILATTHPRDARIQEEARKLTIANQKSGDFSVHVFGWEDLQGLLAKHPRVADKHYSFLRPDLSEIDSGEHSGQIAEILQLVRLNSGISSEDSSSVDDEGEFKDEIDAYRNLIDEGKSRTALDLFLKLKERVWDSSKQHTKFRILTNLGACRLRLGETKSAIELFREAYSYAEDHEKAVANLQMTYLLESNFKVAHRLATEAREKFPSSDRILSNFIASIESEDEAADFLASAPQQQYSATIYHGLYNLCKRFSSLSSQAIEFARQGIAVGDEVPIENRLVYSTELIETICNNQRITIGKQWIEEERKEFEEAISILNDLYEEIMQHEDTVFTEVVANNLAVAFEISGQHEEAERVLDAATAKVNNPTNLLLVKARGLLGQGEVDEAYSLLCDLVLNEWNPLLLFLECCQRKKMFEEAINAIDQYEPKNHLELDILTGYKIEALAETDVESAKVFADELLNDDEGFVTANLSYSSLLRANGDEEAANEYLNTAIANVSVERPYGERFMVAEEAFVAGLWAKASVIYQGLLISREDSPVLRRLAASLYEADDRERLANLFDEMEPAIIGVGYYSRIQAALALRVSDDETAESAMRRYLASDPRDLNVASSLAVLLSRNGRKADAIELLSETEVTDESPIVDRMIFAQVMDRLEMGVDAIELAYDLLRSERNVSELHKRYCALILSGNSVRDIEEVNSIAVGTAFELVDERGVRTNYFIRTEDDPPLSDSELPASHPIAQALLGSHVGDLVEVPFTELQSKSVTVGSITDKYRYLHQDTINNFAIRFPEDNGIVPFELPMDDEGNLVIEPLLNVLAARRDFVANTLQKYEQLPVPIAWVAKQIGIDVVSLWESLQGDRSKEIFCCLGSHAERESAINLVTQGSRFIVDVLTLIRIYQLELLPLLHQSLDKLQVTRSSIDLLLSIAENEELVTSSGVMGANEDGDFYMVDVTEEQIAARIQELKDIAGWAERELEIVTPLGAPAGSAVINKIVGMLDECFRDTLYAASHIGSVILSEDQRLRAFAEAGWDIRGCWLQPVLIALKVPTAVYADFVLDSLERRFTFVSVDAEILRELAGRTDWETNDGLEVVCRSLSRESVEIVSAASVLLGYFSHAYDQIENSSRFRSVIYAALNLATDQCISNNTATLLRQMVYKCSAQDSVFTRLVRDSIFRWAQGHFLTREDLLR